MTLPPEPYPDATRGGPAHVSAPEAPGRAVTEPMRQLVATALLAGNGVFLFLGISDLLFVVTGWAGQFGVRSAATFDSFAGPVAIALPLLAALLATHVAPALPHARIILLAALAEYGVSALFGVITYLGAFAEGLFSVRATFDGLLGRAVWHAFLTIAVTAVYRIYRAMFPPPPKATYSYGPTVYGRPYPGQPSYPRPTNYGPAPAYPADPPTAQTTPLPPVSPGAASAQPASPVAAPTQPLILPTQPVPPSVPPPAPAEPTRLNPPVGGASIGS